eukprot:CAMPEP_0182855654 /NCGR_PEP_ID=MMETSP0034_2-20130328/1977_1 /TAXON_ID=156128 /ORGANISM="Nephroselmis pyriformis, Strain CCMP717" /LENGTH=114 /DNA_ID=CAMNT_0024986655 /DNA_START=329 /DNA_END=670 /DNA_ORIENTATION=+
MKALCLAVLVASEGGDQTPQPIGEPAPDANAVHSKVGEAERHLKDAQRSIQAARESIKAAEGRWKHRAAAGLVCPVRLPEVVVSESGPLPSTPPGTTHAGRDGPLPPRRALHRQ